MPRNPFRRRRQTEATAPVPPGGEARGAAQPPGAARPPGTPAATAAPTPAPADPHQRIDGLRAWLAQVDRKLGVRTYIGAAIAVLALAAAVAALVLVVLLKRDAATK